ncbi:unnamed protein product [Oppiella nova]|uniref:Uncharacterized protein n=1 Tax=Oppiella nova TaxID=334625 RepID=A0A7R9QTR7_9ACAR|nr:unnamed protein product [Oppiella nova]CAG2175339.1 unnamed protein product [Oppiella nova]
MGSVPMEGTVPVTDGSLKSRKNFNVREFARQYGLGEPVAGNFYHAKFDDYVPIITAKLP